ncbi:MAG: carbonic anhydrase, partial [Stenotrophobium sp.]
RLGLIDNWLRHIQDVHDKHAHALAKIGDENQRINRLCELNAIEQAVNVCHTTIVNDAWERGQNLTVHAWAYALHDGRVRDLDFSVTSAADIAPTYEAAIAKHYPQIPRPPAQG